MAGVVFAAEPRIHDVLIDNAVIYDGSGGEPYRGEVAIDGDRIAYVGPSRALKGRSEVDAHDRAVAPGFIHMMGHSEESLLIDGRAVSGLQQGVTLDIFDEQSKGPLTAEMARRSAAGDGRSATRPHRRRVQSRCFGGVRSLEGSPEERVLAGMENHSTVQTLNGRRAEAPRYVLGGTGESAAPVPQECARDFVEPTSKRAIAGKLGHQDDVRALPPSLRRPDPGRGPDSEERREVVAYVDQCQTTQKLNRRIEGGGPAVGGFAGLRCSNHGRNG
jgi:hypothetical protein